MRERNHTKDLEMLQRDASGREKDPRSRYEGEVCGEGEQGSSSSEDIESGEGGEGKESAEDLVALVERFREESERWHDRYARVLADMENVRRRARRDNEEAVRIAQQEIISNMLPILDSFDLALGTRGDKGLREGVAMVQRQFLDMLERAGLESIRTQVGTAFDPHKHNAIGHVKDGSGEPGTVAREMQRGYEFRGRVLRPSTVYLHAEED